MEKEMEEITIKVTTDILITRIKEVLHDKLLQSNLCSDDILELMEAIKLLKEIENK